MSSAIPIRNIYYLLCYAWNRLEEGDLIDVSELDSTELVDLFATVLLNGTHHLLRRGLDQGYFIVEEDLAGIRGRIDVGTTMRRMLNIHGRARCQYDELRVDTLPNQILKATIRYLTHAHGLNKELKPKLTGLMRELGGISDIRLSAATFRLIQLHNNNRFYRFLLDVCELVISSAFIDEATGTVRFRDFFRDERIMAKVFEDFVLNFYRKERGDLDVRREQIKWDAASTDDPTLNFLPTMNTDISVRDGYRTLIIDTKYYKETLQSYYDKQRVHSGNLYQIFSYLKNLEATKGVDAEADGMLLYPVVNRALSLTYTIQNHNIQVCTLDLSKEWQDIRDQLLGFVSGLGGVVSQAAG